MNYEEILEKMKALDRKMNIQQTVLLICAIGLLATSLAKLILSLAVKEKSQTSCVEQGVYPGCAGNDTSVLWGCGVVSDHHSRAWVRDWGAGIGRLGRPLIPAKFHVRLSYKTCLPLITSVLKPINLHITPNCRFNQRRIARMIGETGNFGAVGSLLSVHVGV